MFKNKKVILSSIAIIFTLVVCAIFVNFTLANSGTTTNDSGATTSSTSSLLGYSNIDLAIINSNDSSLQSSGQDTFNVVQILPEGMETNAEADTNMKKLVNDSSYTGSLQDQDDYANTTSLWKYVYDEAYDNSGNLVYSQLFKYAVFEQYKTIDDEMADGAVQLTTVTVSDLNDMDDDAQEILNNADFIYIFASSSSDYASTASDISEDLYSFLDTYATSDEHPLVINWHTLCVEESALDSITGNNDTYRMGALAYKLITKTLDSRYDNVLVVDSDYFYTLYTEASGNYEVTVDSNTTKTISDFIIAAESTKAEGGKNYLNSGSNTYYKWYIDGDGTTGSTAESLATFFGRKSSYDDSAYVKAAYETSAKTGTDSKKVWDFDNAKVLIITDGTSSSMENALSAANSSSSTSSVYRYLSGTSVDAWYSETRASNSTFTSSAYASGISYVPSGADIFVVSTENGNLKNVVESTGTLTTKYLSSSYFENIVTKSVSGTVTSDTDLSEATIYLLAKSADGEVYVVGSGSFGSTTDVDNALTSALTDTTEIGSTTNSYTYSFTQLDTGKYYIDTEGNFKSNGTGYTYIPVLVVGDVGSYTYYFPDDDGTTISTDTTVVTGATPTSALNADLYEDTIIDYLENSNTGDVMNLYLDSSDDVAALVESLHDDYVTYANSLDDSFSISSFSDYDFIFIESGDYKDEINTTAYTLLCEAVEAGTYVIVSGNAGSGVSSSGDGSSSTTVTVTSPSAKAIADIINAGTYRNGSDNKFRVLEIQPDYPIDTELASSNSNSSESKWVGSTNTNGEKITGDYYTVPSDVVSGSAKEELSEGTEYYDFDLTKAKIAYALKDQGISYTDIEITQVSTEALIGMTDDISATYDLVYIGGDISALDRDISKMYGSDVFTWPSGITSASNLSDTIPTFIMYYHTGALISLADSASVYKPTGSKIGDNTKMMATPYLGTTAYTYYTPTYIAENGNDLTETKYEEILSYISTGKPIMISTELTEVYENMIYSDDDNSALTEYQLLQGYWYVDGTSGKIIEKGNYYLDPTSRIYDLVEVLYNAQDDANVLWGFDPDTETMIDNTEQDYGITLYTYNATSDITMLDSKAQSESWYNSADEEIIYNYAVVFDDTSNDAIANLVANSSSRARLTVISSPTAYSEGVESTYLSTTNLSWTFTVNGTGDYTYVVCVDKNKNNQFDYDSGSDDYYSTGTVTGGEEATVNIKLEEDFFGSAYWLIRIFDANDNVVCDSTGISKIVNNTDGISEVNVLQVQTMTLGQNTSTWSSYDHLYFDIMSQTAHKMIKYGVYANQSSLSTSTSTQYASLGRHEYRFGIVEYDYDLYFEGEKGDDNFFTNIADSLTEDYDINLDMVVAESDYASFTTGDGVSDSYDCLDTWVDEAETLASGGTVYDSWTGKSYTQEEYEDMYSDAQQEYADSVAPVEKAKAELDEYIQGAIDVLNGKESTTGYDYGTYGVSGYWIFLGGFNTTNTTKDEVIDLLEYVMETGEYYMLYFAGYSKNSGLWFQSYSTIDEINNSGWAKYDGKTAVAYGMDFTELFIAYRDAKDNMLDLEDKYQSYLRKSYGENFLNKMYSILVIGPSDGFGNYLTDLDIDTCQYILDFVENGGDLFFFHDTMTAYTGSDAGAVNLTTALLDVVGMNRYHVDLTDNNNSYTVETTAHATSVSTSDTLVSGTLSEDGYIYVVGTWDGSYSESDGWERVSGSMTVDYGNYTGTSSFIWRKQATAGTSGYILQEAGTVTTSGTDTSITYSGPNSKYVSDADSSKYYMSSYISNQNAGNSLVSSINLNMAELYNPSGTWYSAISSGTGMYVSALSMTSLYYSKNGGDASYTIPYIYANSNFQSVTSWAMSSTTDQSATSATVKASQLNEGLITLYPYQIGDSLNISGTHQQAYALDLESDKVTVWYTLAGSNNSDSAKYRSSLYAADPYDAMENYFIYSTYYGKGTITYCGAGHNSITGPTTKNNDERKLFINVIVNSADAVKEKPSLKIYEPDTDLTEELEKDTELTAETGKTVYLIEADGKTDTVDFDIDVTIPDDIIINSIRIYFDVKWTEDTTRPSYSTADGDVLIWSSASAGEASSMYSTITLLSDANDETEIAYALRGIQLSDAYFSYTGSNYAYIVVEIYYDNKTTPVYSVIKIKVSDPLFELTEGTYSIDLSLDDYIAEEKFKLS